MALFPGESIARYQVTGLVEFSYTDYESKIGGKQATSYRLFTQTYNAGITSPILDPRFLVLQGNVGYSKTTASGGSADTHGLTYGLNASFFAGSKISWDLYGTKSTTTVQSQSLLPGYDISTKTYGGNLNLNLSRGNGIRNNNRNNNNNNNNFERWTPRLPDILLSYNHNEMESLNTVNPLRQTRDDTKASIEYRLRYINLHLDGMLEKFKDLELGSSYDTKTANFDAQARLSPGVDLDLTARLMDRTTTNLSGFNPSDTSAQYGARLDFAEKNGIQQFYRFDYTNQENIFALYTTNKAEAGITYRILEGFLFHGGLTYGTAEYKPKENVNQPQAYYYKQDIGSLLAGISYVGTYQPDFLDPFIIHTNYDFTLGYSKISTPVLGVDEGNGFYYTNSAGAGITSSGWKTETLSADATYTSRRDQSAAAFNQMQQNYALNASTTRIPKTNLRSSLNYNILESSNKYTNVFLQQGNSAQVRRGWIFHVDADYTATPYLLFTAGASRDRSTTNMTTLSTLTPQESRYQYLQTWFYGSATFNYLITRNLQYRAEFREEYRIDDATKTETQTHRVNMNMDYRIRMILIGLEYRLQQDIPNNSLRVTQQQYVARISRPF